MIGFIPMAIPDDETLKRELLLFLSSEPGARAGVWHVYEQLAQLHPELTEDEKSKPYRNSASKWANRVQFARLHLVNAGMLFKANAVPNAPRNYWALTPQGQERALTLKALSNSPSVEPTLEQQVAADIEAMSEEECAIEGLKTERLIAHFERNPKLRAAAIALHGTTCKACGFNFEAAYGRHGKNFIEVHHLVPVSRLASPSSVNPREDLTVLCSNCHRMVHRKRDTPLSLAELIALVKRQARGSL
jgi:predicted HNH restriction endonuclease